MGDCIQTSISHKRKCLNEAPCEKLNKKVDKLCNTCGNYHMYNTSVRQKYVSHVDSDSNASGI